MVAIINLGDCFDYALAVAGDGPILALDTDFGGQTARRPPAVAAE